MLCVSDAAVFGVVVLVAGRAPDYISTAARKRDEPAWRVCRAVRAFPKRGSRLPPVSYDRRSTLDARAALPSRFSVLLPHSLCGYVHSFGFECRSRLDSVYGNGW